MRLVVATRNRGKVAEIQELLQGLPIEVVSGAEAQLEEVEETGSTYEENALLKARAASRQTGSTALADDSGLEVDALNGKPGVRSSRFAGPSATDAERSEKVLRLLEGVEGQARSARFRCAIALVSPAGQETVVTAACEGVIARAPRGEHGFGYDPIFEVPELGKTMAELSRSRKSEISHRGKALRLAREVLARMAAPADAPR